MKHMRYAIGLENPKTGERRAMVVELTPKQQWIANTQPLLRSTKTNGFLVHNAAKAAPAGFQWDGDLGAIRLLSEPSV
jgi:hypothetical protein